MGLGRDFGFWDLSRVASSTLQTAVMEFMQKNALGQSLRRPNRVAERWSFVSMEMPMAAVGFTLVSCRAM
jgi:hypothetical protein